MILNSSTSKTERMRHLGRGRARAAMVVACALLLAASTQAAQMPALAAQPAAQAAPGGVTIADVARTRAITAAEISPDGSQIAYLLSIPRDPMREDDGGNYAELHVMSLAGGGEAKSRPFISGAVNVSAIQWTPDSKAIAFLARRAGDRFTSIYMISTDGGEARRIASADANITGYALCPHMHHVVWLAQEAVPEARRKLAERGFNQDVFEENLRPVRVWMAETDESGVALKPRMFDLPGSASNLKWNPGGGQIALGLAPTPLVDDDLMNKKVVVIDEHDGKIIARFDNPGKLGAFEWSPDGKYLAFISAADRNDPQQGRLMVAPAAGGPMRELLPNYMGHVSGIAWQSNDTVMYIGNEGVWTTLAKVSLSGERKTLVATGGTILTAFSLSGDGQSAAFIGQSDHRPSDVFTMKHGDAAPRRLTNINPWLAERKLAAQEVVKYKARDGVEIEGLLILPLGADVKMIRAITREREFILARTASGQETQRYPLILVVHGGPEAHFSNGWLTSYSNPGQVAAARGYAVFYPNYRGSTGRGVAFSKLSQGDAAGKEFDDYVDGVDFLIASGLVDKAKVGITGGSYGGYATAWGSTYYSERFAAGVMFVGISDKLAKFGTTDIAQEETLVHALHLPWENYQKFLERSPIYHVKKHRTPLLILGGMDDPRVHPTQSMILYRYLKTLNQAPVRWIRYPGEQHGNRRAASRLDYNLRLMQWMDHYLKGPGGAPPPAELSYEAMK